MEKTADRGQVGELQGSMDSLLLPLQVQTILKVQVSGIHKWKTLFLSSELQDLREVLQLGVSHGGRGKTVSAKRVE